MAQKRLNDTTLSRLNELFPEFLALYDSERGYQPGTRGSYDKNVGAFIRWLEGSFVPSPPKRR
jgi:hypothetical protein